VQVEVDKRRNLVRATAMGTTELRRRDDSQGVAGERDSRDAAARSMHVDTELVRLEAETGGFQVYSALRPRRGWFGALSPAERMTRVVDRTAVVRLQRGAAHVAPGTVASAQDALTRAVDILTDYGDAGRAIPDVFILHGARIVNLSGLASLDQVLALAEVELRSLDPQTPLVVISCPKQP